MKKIKGENVFLLVDPILISDQIKDILNKSKNTQVYSLFEGTINSHIDFFSSPLLLNYKKLNDSELDSIVDLCVQTKSALSIFSSKEKIDKKIAILKRMMFPIVNEKIQFFRFYEFMYFSKLDEIFDNNEIYKSFIELYLLVDDYKSFEANYIFKRVI
ncbi:DUF4123 domain-containing protein [Acinetobacter shaoyimingii]|uniref:DUF4123 domain-containing protein n=1 Tax=Acinetobacter shaoyimingii TaxID=2715164 RepID=A0A6G8RSD7_9GAMM|nr:DUF4123 domain-containing protein [Acinetobacter shaoyimingii]QIO04787.1 DUF4123 domain-containing protein [Acinetobacter shaoyimingii]